MKAEKFSECLNNIDDKYIEEASSAGSQISQNTPGFQTPPVPQSDNGKNVKGLKVWRIIAIAACAVLAVGLTIGAIALITGRSERYYQDAAPAPAGGANQMEDRDYQAEENMAFEPITEGADVPLESSDSQSYGSETSKDGISAAPGGSLTVPSPAPTNENAKIIYTANLSIETTEFDESQSKISEITEKHGGYFENMDINNASSSYRSAYYQIRIPVANLDAFLNESSTFGNITSASRNANDVSESYYDTEARLESAQAKLKRLEELYAEAQNMSDIIVIENEISNVQWEIDNLQGTLKHYDSQVDYSTVTINLNEVYKTSTEAVPLSFGERISKAFSEGLSTFGEVMEDLVIWLAESWLWILLVVIVIGAAIIITVHVLKKDSKTKTKK